MKYVAFFHTNLNKTFLVSFPDLEESLSFSFVGTLEEAKEEARTRLAHRFSKIVGVLWLDVNSKSTPVEDLREKFPDEILEEIEFEPIIYETAKCECL